MNQIIGNEFIYNGIQFPNRKGEKVIVTGWTGTYTVYIKFLSDEMMQECHLKYLSNKEFNPYISTIQYE